MVGKGQRSDGMRQKSGYVYALVLLPGTEKKNKEKS
jgi:hypothetical protein